MFGYHDRLSSADSDMEQPLVWITNEMDRSPGELLWVTSDKWGLLKGSLLNISYGTGRIFVVPHEKIRGRLQGGVVQLPIPDFPTGTMRGRFHPGNGRLYLRPVCVGREPPGGRRILSRARHRQGVLAAHGFACPH